MNSKAKAKEEAKEAEAPKTDVSRFTDSLRQLFNQYLSVCFKIIDNLKYSSVQEWKRFTQGDVAVAADEKRTFSNNIKDIFVLAAIGYLLVFIAFWWLTVPFFFFSIPILLLGVLLSPLPYLINAAILHVLAKLLGGKGRYNDALSIMVLSSAASLLLSIPLSLLYAILIGLLFSSLNYACWAYAIYLQYKSLMQVYGLSQKRSIVAIVAYFGIGFSIVILLYMLLALLRVLT